MTFVAIGALRAKAGINFDIICNFLVVLLSAFRFNQRYSIQLRQCSQEMGHESFLTSLDST